MARSVASKKSSWISSGSRSTPRSGMRKVPARSGWSGLMLRPTELSSMSKRNPGEQRVGGVRPVVHQSRRSLNGSVNAPRLRVGLFSPLGVGSLRGARVR